MIQPERSIVTIPAVRPYKVQGSRFYSTEGLLLVIFLIPLRTGKISHWCLNKNEDQMKWKLQRNEGETISPRLGVMGKG